MTLGLMDSIGRYERSTRICCHNIGSMRVLVPLQFSRLWLLTSTSEVFLFRYPVLQVTCDLTKACKFFLPRSSHSHIAAECCDVTRDCSCIVWALWQHRWRGQSLIRRLHRVAGTYCAIAWRCCAAEVEPGAVINRKKNEGRIDLSHYSRRSCLQSQRIATDRRSNTAILQPLHEDLILSGFWLRGNTRRRKATT